MSLSSMFAICAPREDILKGAIAESDFAADLAQILKGDAPKLGKNNPIRVTTAPDYFDLHPESVELWSPGSPVFPDLESGTGAEVDLNVMKNLV